MNKQLTMGEEKTPKDLLKILAKQNPEGGEITLKDFADMLPHMDYKTITQELKNAPRSAGIYVPGRRGLETRFVFGPPAEPLIAEIESRRARSTGNGSVARRPRQSMVNNHRGPGRPRRIPTVEAELTPNENQEGMRWKSDLVLTVRLGGAEQKITFPLEIEAAQPVLAGE